MSVRTARHWYILRSATRQEKRAVEALKEAGFEAYCPMEARWERIGLRRMREKRERAYLPGYLFCRIGDGQFAAVEAADGVSCVLRYTTSAGLRSPRSAPTSLVAAIQIAESVGLFDKTREAEHESGFRIGQKVKVLVGAWWGHIATITKLDAKGRIEVLHSIFGRDAPQTYEVKQIEAAPPPGETEAA